MNPSAADAGRPPHLIWIYPQSLTRALDAATWLDTTHELRRLGWRVTLLAVGNPGTGVIRGIEFTGIAKPRRYLWGQIAFHAACLRLILKHWHDADAILFHPLSLSWLLPLRLLRLLTRNRKPLLVMDTRTLPMEARDSESIKDKLRRWYFNSAHWMANRFADGQTAITPEMAEAVRIPPPQLWGVWPSGVDLDMFEPARAARRWAVKPNPVRLIYVGSLHHERNLMTLSAAVTRAREEGLNLHLTLVGDGSERSKLECCAIEHASAVRVLPPVPHAQVPELLAGADVGVLPFPDELKFRVSSPIKLFEYLAAGLPVLATHLPFMHAILGDHACVFWARGSDEAALLEALREIAAAQDRLPELGRQTAGIAVEWTWQRAALKLNQALMVGLQRVDSGRAHHQSEARQT